MFYENYKRRAVAAVLCWHKMLEGGGGGFVVWDFRNFPYPLGLKVKVFFTKFGYSWYGWLQNVSLSTLFQAELFNINPCHLHENLLGTHIKVFIFYFFFRYVASWTFYYPLHNHHLFAPIYLRRDIHTQKNTQRNSLEETFPHGGRWSVDNRNIFISAMCPSPCEKVKHESFSVF